ncbi:MAG: phosphatase PAP2 family protein [Bacillus sp. (in: firmicutes)]
MDEQTQEYAGKSTYIRAGLVILAFITFLVLMYGINSEYEFSWEKPVQSFFQSWNSGFGARFFTIWTELGSIWFIGLSTILMCAWLAWKKRDFVAVGIVALLVVGGNRLNVFIKHLVARERPEVNEAIDAIGYSFPSGHSLLSIVTYGIVAYFLAYYSQVPGTRFLIWLGAAVIIAMTGISRIVLSAHFPTDVAAGFCLGFVLLVMACTLYPQLKHWVGRIPIGKKK